MSGIADWCKDKALTTGTACEDWFVGTIYELNVITADNGGIMILFDPFIAET